MDILWPAMGIVIIVAFVFYVLARHWQSVLRQQSWTLRQLAQRVRNLEEMADPELRRRLGEAAPLPLEQVFTLSLRLSDRFWRDTLRLNDVNRQFIRDFGSFLGSLKLERWRSHIVATVSEIPPGQKAAVWHTRTLDFYPDSAATGESLTLWELALARPGHSAERPPSLELLLRHNALDLCAHLDSQDHPSSGHGRGKAASHQEILYFHLPLDPARLEEFRAEEAGEEAFDGEGAPAPGSFWQACYAHADEALGIEWHLRLRDLNRKAEWERWKILDSGAAPINIE